MSFKKKSEVNFTYAICNICLNCQHLIGDRHDNLSCSKLGPADDSDSWVYGTNTCDEWVPE